VQENTVTTQALLYQKAKAKLLLKEAALGENHIDRGVIARLEDINSGKASYHRLGETISPRWDFSLTALTGIEDMDPQVKSS
jgi:hypothetical protein